MNNEHVLDIVIPVFNEAEALGYLFERLQTVLTETELGKYSVSSFRTIFVDDGSSDESAALIADFIRGNPRHTLVRFSRNFGHTAAVVAGLEHATGDVVSIMDADLQDPPEVILDMLRLWREGNAVVHACRRSRKESLFKVTCYKAFYRIMNKLADIRVPLDSGEFCVMDRKVVAAICALPERLKFVRFLRTWVGYRQATVAYDRDARIAGKTSYSLASLYRLATSGFVSSGTTLLRLSQAVCVCFLIAALLLGIAYIAVLVTGANPGAEVSAALAVCCVVLFSNGVVALLLYVLGGYLGRVYLEVQRRPPYIVMERLGYHAEDAHRAAPQDGILE